MTEKEFLKKLGKKIADIRKSKGMTQADVCALVNMETTYYSSIENGRQNTSTTTLFKISNALGVKVREFF